ncbi:hypothetical protein HOG17_04600 [Candidatus Peregrinibacteria bacterium]|jgi:hypothetical protein|nr:hypothetical protein [Candidatus Peregrinibacteria bacterium]MBT4147846.1 hypothetical protein [Candidatus Peregrinibacteria bacterium]MBT4366187.1 hypothetical protein [Candidatus Peregrinibacteria bacterium]MBT4455592.1 hypothetical protein [Candidatus Peregrinibacteria bacterium]
MINISSVPIDSVREDPGAHWFRALAEQYPEQFAMVPGLTVDERKSPQTIRQDEKGQDAQNPQITSGLFEYHRKAVRHLFRAIMEEIFRTHDIPREGGVDIGSGITGEMVNEWLPLSDDQLQSWTETDINREAVETNRLRRQSGSSVKIASMYDLEKDLKLRGQKIPVITGLSSLDAPAFLERAISSIRNALVRGGHLVHIQDVRPGIHMGTDQLKHEQKPGPHTVGFARPPEGINIINPHVYFRPDGSFESSVELFRRRLGRSIMGTSGLRLVKNEWVVATEPTEDESSYVYAMNMRGPLPTGYTGGSPSNLACAVVTIAQKV